MRVTKKEYSEMVKSASPPSPCFKNLVSAFLTGGAICSIGQLLKELYTSLSITNDVVKMLVSVSLIFLAIVLTACHLFDNIAKHAGAGTLVPITGFANAVASPAIEFKSEGWVLGVGANIFKIAGPVIAYGTIASVIYGVVFWIMQQV